MSNYNSYLINVFGYIVLYSDKTDNIDKLVTSDWREGCYIIWCAARYCRILHFFMWKARMSSKTHLNELYVYHLGYSLLNKAYYMRIPFVEHITALLCGVKVSLPLIFLISTVLISLRVLLVFIINKIIKENW
jgi:hypothetical protein